MNSLNKVTYILGAGASANALPTVKDYTASMGTLAVELKLDSSVTGDNFTLLNNLCDDLLWLAENAKEFSSIDTFAKHCFQSKKYKEFDRLKSAISFYFMVKQFVFKVRDKRYLNLITKLSNTVMFPDNIKFLNWNYDFQIQLVGEEFYKKEHISYLRGGTTKYSFPYLQYFPTLGGEYNINNRLQTVDLSLVHLNGIAGFFYHKTHQQVLNYYYSGIDDLNHLLDKMRQDNDRKETMITFAFEHFGDMQPSLGKSLHYAQKMIENTDYLVVIGYSFGSDNFQTDKLIFDTLKKGQLKGIYFQDPFNDGQFLRRLFDLHPDIFIEPVSAIDTFCIPREINKEKPALLK